MYIFNIYIHSYLISAVSYLHCLFTVPAHELEGRGDEGQFLKLSERQLFYWKSELRITNTQTQLHLPSVLPSGSLYLQSVANIKENHLVIRVS